MCVEISPAIDSNDIVYTYTHRRRNVIGFSDLNLRQKIIHTDFNRNSNETDKNDFYLYTAYNCKNNDE